MIIKELYLEEGMCYKNCKFLQKNLVYSQENSQGKTTLIRLILHSLGYAIPSNGNMEFDNIQTKIIIETDEGKRITLERSGNNINYFCDGIEYEFVLPFDLDKLHLLLFGIDDINLLNNLLGAMYIDQTKGNVIFNRGIIIGNIGFNIEKFVAGLENINITLLLKKISDEQTRLKDYISLRNIAQYKIENKIETNENNPLDSNCTNNETINKIISIKDKIKYQNNECSQIKQILSENLNFQNVIQNYNIFVKSSNGEKIPVNSKTICGYKDNKELVEMQIKILNASIISLKQELKSLEEPKNICLDLETIDYKNSVDSSLKNINLDYNTINSMVASSRSIISSLKKQIGDNIKKNDIVNYLQHESFECAKELGVAKFFDDKQGIFTSKVGRLSGANGYKLIISFHIAYLKTIQKYKNKNLPFIIDSLRNNEIDQANADEILSTIKKQLPDHQIIIASIYDYDNFFNNKITISERLIDILKN